MYSIHCLSRSFLVGTLLIAFGRPLSAQCLDWKDGFQTAGVNRSVLASAVFNDGTGPALFAGGAYDMLGPNTGSLVKWNGSTFTSLSGVSQGDEIDALAVYDDGLGLALYIGAHTGVDDSNAVLKWNGTQWTLLGDLSPYNQNSVLAFTVFDDGSGPQLYAGGYFSAIGSVNVDSIAKWNGVTWSGVGNGFAGGTVRALTAFDDGSGVALYAGGDFTSAGGVPANRIARWNGSTWSALGEGTDNSVESLCVHDDGSGSALYVGGAFNHAGHVSTHGIARWNGTSWSGLAGGMNATSSVFALGVYDDGSGPALHAGGDFTNAGGVAAKRIARWNGSNWHALGPAGSGADDLVYTLCAHDDGSGPALYAGGAFLAVGGTNASHLGRWKGSTWTPLTTGHGLSDPAFTLTTFDDGSGTALYAGGDFTTAGGVPASRVAKWNGSSWSPLGSGLGDGFVDEFRVFDDGGGPGLYVGGDFVTAGGVSADFLAKWNGSTWSGVGGGLNGPVEGLTVFDDGSGPALYVSGEFDAAGGMNALSIAKWDGSTWSALGSGLSISLLSYPYPRQVRALTVFDDGSGPALYAAGIFDTAGGLRANSIAKWNGSSWSALGKGIERIDGPDRWTGIVSALCVFDDGSGPALFVGGSFTLAGGHPAHNIAKWTGSAWAEPGGGVNSQVFALTAFDAGLGLALYVGGFFSIAGSVHSDGIAEWNGSAWSAVGGGLTGYHGVLALGVFDDGLEGGPDLYLGGPFSMVGNSKVSSGIAEWLGCGRVAQGFCFGDGTATPCPCGNSGALGNGCANSVNAAGANLSASGTTNPDSVALMASGMPGTVMSIFLKGSGNIGSGVVFGDGIRCAGGQLIRLGHETNVGGAATYPSGAQLSVSVKGSTPPGSGLIGYYQTYYRNAAAAFCPPATFNVTNGLTVVW